MPTAAGMPSASRCSVGGRVADFRIEAADRSGTAVDLDHARAAARFLLAALQLHVRTELSIAYVSWGEMERLHLQYMDEPGATDVLSFPMDELRRPAAGELAVAGALGDIVICPEFAAKQVAAGGLLVDELDLLLCHGILHLLGYDHAEPLEHAEMFGLQSELLEAWRKRGAGR